jgi:ribosomal protein S18 acetylase RimI-like enzyme
VLIVNIQPLTPNNAEAYQRLMFQALRDFPLAFGASYEEGLEEPVSAVAERIGKINEAGDEIIGAFDESGELVGVVGLRRERMLKFRHKGVIWGFFVRPDQQGKGLGRRLMDAALTKARSIEGLEQLTLVVAEANTTAQKLYESFGFERFGLEPREIKVNGGYYNSVYMWLKL